MSQATKKNINLNRLKTGCWPSMNEAKLMQQKISNRKVYEIKINEIKDIVLSMFKKN